jgi:hypothetical protein
MNAYRKQQLRAAELIEQGATAEQIAAVYGWTARGEPEQSAQTGYNQTLTEPRKCGIIKAIRRHVRRWKRKQEGKTMKNAKNYFDKNGFIFGDSAKFNFGKWEHRIIKFTDFSEAEKWLDTEEYDFRERELISKTTAKKYGYTE